jgi:hypothetical protein
MSIDNINLSPNFFPYQKRNAGQKNKKFFKDCIDAGITLTNWEGRDKSGVRSSKKNKIINYNLFNDVVDKKEMDRVVNPFKIKDATFPATYRNYPLLNPNFELLFGEERKRIFNPIPIVLNEDAISEKVQSVDEEFSKILLDELMTSGFDEQKLQKRLQELQDWSLYTYKDKRERMANQVINYLYKTQDLKEEFSRGFMDLTISSEQIYVADIYGNEPILRKGNPLNFTTLRSGESYKIEDSDIIVEEGYMPIGQVIDRYYDDLSPTQITKLEQGYRTSQQAKAVLGGQLLNEPLDLNSYIDSVGGIGSVLSATDVERHTFAGAFNLSGEVLVRRVVWRGMRKIGVKSYYDDDNILQKDLVSEHYVPKTEEGEEVKWIWISEWYEGTKIGDDEYIRMQPRPMQMRSMDNLSVSHPGIVGTVFNVNNNKGKSMMDFGKPWQYLWNIFMYRTELAFAKAKGRIGKLQAHLVPDGWDMDKWMYYAEVMGWAVEDAFNEGNRGASTGKLAGAMNQSNQVLDLEMGNYIQQHISMLDFIDKRASEITGITPQRKGAIENRETVGGVERAVMQSSHITERWFGVHDNTKVRALTVLLETAKVAWKSRSFKRFFALDDGSLGLLEYDDNLFRESDYGIHISTATDDMEMIRSLKSLAGTFLQNNGSLSIVADLYRTKNPADLQRKIQKYEQGLQEQAAQQAQAEREQFEAELAKQEEQENLDRMLEYDKLDNENINKQLDREKDILVAEIRALGFAKDPDVNENQIPDVVEQSKVNLAYMKEAGAKASKEKELKSKQEIENKKLKLKKEELASKERLQKQKDKAALEREKLKSKTALKNKVVGEK